MTWSYDKLKHVQKTGMTELSITEAVSVPFPMVRHAAEIGWTPLTPQAAMQKRRGEAGRSCSEIAGHCEILAWRRGEWQGENHVEIRIVQRAPYRPGAEIVLEKLEVHLRYAA